MKFTNSGKSSRNFQQPQHCELCDVIISGKSYHDVRSSGALRGKGKTLCSKCYGVLMNMPAEKALEALNAASETEPKNKLNI